MNPIHLTILKTMRCVNWNRKGKRSTSCGGLSHRKVITAKPIPSSGREFPGFQILPGHKGRILPAIFSRFRLEYESFSVLWDFPMEAE